MNRCLLQCSKFNLYLVRHTYSFVPDYTKQITNLCMYIQVKQSVEFPKVSSQKSQSLVSTSHCVWVMKNGKLSLFNIKFYSTPNFVNYWPLSLSLSCRVSVYIPISVIRFFCHVCPSHVHMSVQQLMSCKVRLCTWWPGVICQANQSLHLATLTSDHKVYSGLIWDETHKTIFIIILGTIGKMYLHQSIMFWYEKNDQSKFTYSC